MTTVRVLVLSCLAILAGCDVLKPGGRRPLSDAGEGTRASELLVQAERLQGREDYIAAAEVLRERAELRPDDVLVQRDYMDAARLAGATGLDAMRAHYRRVPDRAGSPIVPYVRAAAVESDQERIALLEEAIARDPGFHWAYLSLGRTLRSIRKPGAAFEKFERAVELAPECAPCNLDYADALAEVGRVEEAELYYRNYLELKPDPWAEKVLIQLLVYDSYGDRKRLDEAFGRVERLMSEGAARDLDLLMNKAAIHWQRGELLLARDSYQQVIRLGLQGESGDWSRAMLNLGNLYYQALPAQDEGSESVWWPKARDAYLFLQQHSLQAGEPQGLFDLLDLYVAIPYRLERINEKIKAADPGHVPVPLKTF